MLESRLAYCALFHTLQRSFIERLNLALIRLLNADGDVLAKLLQALLIRHVSFAQQQQPLAYHFAGRRVDAASNLSINEVQQIRRESYFHDFGPMSTVRYYD